MTNMHRLNYWISMVDEGKLGRKTGEGLQILGVDILNPKINVLGTEIQTCSTDPLTGWYRDGCCNTDSNDRGLHVVCCTTDKFLEFAKSRGNDLITPAPQFNFPGLQRW